MITYGICQEDLLDHERSPSLVAVGFSEWVPHHSGEPRRALITTSQGGSRGWWGWGGVVLGHLWGRPFSCFLIPHRPLHKDCPLSCPPSTDATTTGRPSPALAASSLNKLGQLSYLPPHLPLGSCGGVGVVVRGGSGWATERRDLGKALHSEAEPLSASWAWHESLLFLL